ncbi:hypothetical protein DPMN_123775 [Dreissena polymorpha]|uniref:C1q domain-containing protein n=1 Tax=Dreissena polymorpha TaxID=45954 RepID=A0A9D4JRU6_DREPO|nr:hypothetical protein DPMN_123775 [Dreissena polymorpha]
MCAENGEVRATMVHNGNLVARVYCHGDGGKYDQGSQTVVIQLNAGDEVAVQSGEFVDDKVWRFVYSSFSGYLVWPQ